MNIDPNGLDLDDRNFELRPHGATAPAGQSTAGAAVVEHVDLSGSDDHPGYVTDPTTGVMVSLADADGLIDAYERIKALDQSLYLAKCRVIQALAALTTGETKTRRVRGQRRRAVVTMPDDNWDQSVLREAWNAYPKFRDQALAISQIRVRLREFGKIENESGPADFEQFKRMLVAARREPTANPTIKIEE